MNRIHLLCPLLAVLLLVHSSVFAQKKPDRAQIKEFNRAVKMLSSKKGRDEGIETLQSFAKKTPADALSEKAKEILDKNGIGEKFRVQLIDMKNFKRLGQSPKSIFDLVQQVHEEVAANYKRLKPVFKNDLLNVRGYDSEGRYRKDSKRRHANGHFSVLKRSFKDSSLLGEGAWFYQQKSGSPKDRMTTLKGTLYFEIAQYLNAVHFDRMIPPLIDAGLATYYRGKYNKEHYDAYRTTDREIFEGHGRDGLGSIVKYKDFEKYLAAPWGFGKGGRLLDRWLGLSFALCDFFERGAINSRRGSVERMLGALEKKAATLRDDPKKAKSLKPPSNKAALEELVKEFYACDLKTFHKALVKHISANFHQP